MDHFAAALGGVRRVVDSNLPPLVKPGFEVVPGPPMPPFSGVHSGGVAGIESREPPEPRIVLFGNCPH